MKASSAREAWKRARARVRAERDARPRIVPGGFTGYAVESSPFWLGLLVVLGVIAEVISMLSAVNSRLHVVIEDRPDYSPVLQLAPLPGGDAMVMLDKVPVARILGGAGLTPAHLVLERLPAA